MFGGISPPKPPCGDGTVAKPTGKRLIGRPRTKWRHYHSDLAASRLSVESGEPSELAEISYMGVGRRNIGPLDFQIFSKKGCFLVVSGKKQISPLLPPPGKNLSDAHDQ